MDANIKISLRKNSSDNIAIKTFDNSSISLKNETHFTLEFHEKEHHILNKQDKNFLKKFNILNLKNHGFKHNVTDFLKELIRFKIWKLNHLKLKPISNKGENLNYFQKSEKNINIDKITNLIHHKNKTMKYNTSKLPIKQNSQIILSKNFFLTFNKT